MPKPTHAKPPESGDGIARTVDRARIVWLTACAALAAIAVAVYMPSLNNGFVFDDADLITTERQIRSLSNIGSMLAGYRPMRTLTYAVDYAIWGMNPMGFRLTNIAIHAINVVLALFVARKITGSRLAASICAALVFALHPVQVESVAYISGRRDVLFALFYLAAFLAYTRFREASAPRARWSWLGAAVALFGLSLASKEMAASLPLVCALWDVWRATSPTQISAASSAGRFGKFMREGGLVYAIGAAVLVAFAYYTIVIRGATTRMLRSSFEFWGGSALNNLLTVPLTYAHYVWLVVWPRTLAAQYYGAFDPATGFADPRVLPAIVLLAVLAVGSIVLLVRSNHRIAGFGIAWFLLTLLPASQILPHHEIVADHYLYLPSLGAGLVLADLLLWIEERWKQPMIRRAAFAACGILLAVLAARAVVRERDFRDEATLWEATYAAVPNSPRAAYNYGLVLTNRGEHERAIPYYQQAIERDPTFAQAYFNLASTYASLGDTEAARNVYRDALKTNIELSARSWHLTPEILLAMYETELAWLDAQSGDTAGARDRLSTILARLPDLLRTQEFYANVLQLRGETDATILALQDRVASAPENWADRCVLASLLWKTGHIEDARAQIEAVVAARPTSAVANLYLGRYYREMRGGQNQTASTATTYFANAEKNALTPFDAETVKRLASGGNAPRT